MTPLTGKTALVTGASRGIGRAIATRLAADVAVHFASNQADADDVVDTIVHKGGTAYPVCAEFGIDGAAQLVDQLRDGLNGRLLDILVNNAGILDPTPFELVDSAAFDRCYTINVRAPFFLIQRVLPLMPDGGRIVNISSAVTRIASAFTQYAMNKAAIEALGRTLANALGPRGITVNTVAPGVVETDMGSWVDSAPGLRERVVSSIALGRLGQPADIADVVAFLASPDGRWLTGVTIEATGGQWLGPPAQPRP